MFQFLIGRLKTLLYKNSGKVFVVFQFLIGRLKTLQLSKKYEENGPFQFLIGRLKTLQVFQQVLFPPLFQFLIGRLKTRSSVFWLIHRIHGFNSLQVGSKPIEKILSKGEKKNAVSIPYRQAQNEEIKREQGGAKWSFNSLQVGSKRYYIISVTYDIGIQFQFLIGRLKTPRPLQLELPATGEFQFLIGRLKTQELLPNIPALEQVSIPYRQAQNG